MTPTPETYIEERPWGSFELFKEDTLLTVKIITVRAGEAFSLQYHNHRDELWRILKGNGEVRIGDETKQVAPGETYQIPRLTVHRATGGTEDLVILELATGEFEESDIVRLEDKYGRIPNAVPETATAPAPAPIAP